MLNDRDKLNGIEKLKNKLFSRDYQMENDHVDHFSSVRFKKVIPDSWQESVKDKMTKTQKIFTQKSSIFKKFFIFSVAFFILALLYGGYMFFIKGNTVSNKNIEITVLGNSFVAGGESLPLQIEIVNKNNSNLLLSDLLIEYPKNSSGDLSKETERIRESLGTIPAGGIKSENIKIILFGEQGSIRPIRISLEYRLEGSNSIFVKEKLHEVSISSAPINLLIEGPSEVSLNQDINLKVKVNLNSTNSASQILLKMDYPIGFEFTSASPTPSFGDNVWNLGDIQVGSENEISIFGKMAEVFDGEEKVFHVFSGSQSSSDKSSIGIIFNSLSHKILVKKPFIEAKLFVNNSYQREYVVDSKNKITGQVRWVNNLDTKINDLEIVAKITGNIINEKSINPKNGFYDSSTKSIVWNKSFEYNFSEVDPGDNGIVSFDFLTFPLFSSVGGIVADPSVYVDISISGKQPLEGNASQKLVNSESKVIKVLSDVGLATKALYFSGPFKNSGPIPPKKEQETTYTIVWAISNTSNNLSNVQVRSSLPAWVNFVGNISPPSEDLKYNSSSKELIWNIGALSRGSGISQEGREIAFQISLKPSISQLNTSPVIINETVLSAKDDFANAEIKVYRNSLNTRLLNDPSFPTYGEIVIE